MKSLALLITVLVSLSGFSQYYEASNMEHQIISSQDPAGSSWSKSNAKVILQVDHETKGVNFHYLDQISGEEKTVVLHYAYCERSPGKQTMICHSSMGSIYRVEIDHAKSEALFVQEIEEGMYITTHVYRFGLSEIMNWSSRVKQASKTKRHEK